MKKNFTKKLFAMAMMCSSFIGISAPIGTLDVDAGATNSANFVFAGQTIGQSFVPNYTGQLVEIRDIGINSGSANCVFRILLGDGTGTVLFSTPVILNGPMGFSQSLYSTPINITAGVKYTWQMIVQSGSMQVNTSIPGGYAGGVAYVNGAPQTYDFGFRTLVNGSLPLSITGGVCGTTLSSADQTINWTGTQGATNYRVRVISATSTYSTVNTRNSTNKYVKLTWIPGIKYGETYNVSVSAYVNGAWGSYGPTCQVSTSAASAAPTCSLTLSSQVLSTLDQTINFTGVPLATNYRLEISSAAQSFTTVNVRNNTVLNYKMSWISGVQYGRTYNVRVSAFLNGAWQAYGPTSTVTTPSTIPSSQLTTCGQAVPSLSTVVNFNPVAGASKYRVEVTPSVGTPSVNVRPNNLTTWALSFQTGTKCGEGYSIRVSAYVGGVWGPYGQPCTLYCNNSMQRTNSFDEITEEELAINIYPNPNDGNFNLDLNESAKVEVVDMLGRVVFNESFESGKQNISLSGNENGVYFVKITTANKEVLKKIVVSK